MLARAKIADGEPDGSVTRVARGTTVGDVHIPRISALGWHRSTGRFSVGGTEGKLIVHGTFKFPVTGTGIQ